MAVVPGTPRALMGRIGTRLCVVLVLGGTPVHAQTGSAADSAFTLPRTRVHAFHSRLNGRDYRLIVALPEGYSARTASRYPVLYLLDGGIALPAAAITYRVGHRGASDSLILVGVGYAGGVSFRAVDYTLPLSSSSDSVMRRDAREGRCCGAAVMNRVFREEIIPLIDERYRTTGDRGIFGHSFGGLLANYLLFADPNLFQRYAISSPSLWWDNNAIFDHEEAFARANTALRKRVYFSIGSLEGMAMTFGVQRMAATMRARAYQGLDLTNVELAGAFHSSAAEYSRALDALYPQGNAIEMFGDSAVRDTARSIVRGFLAAYTRRDAGAVRRHLAGDSAFQAIVDAQLILGRDRYAAHLARRFSALRALMLDVDTLRINGAGDRATAFASYSQTATPRTGPEVTTRGRVMFSLAQRPEGWRIVYALDEPRWPPPVFTSVRVMAGDGVIARASVEAFNERGRVALAQTDSTGVARLPYDWHLPLDGHLQVRAPGYALAMIPLPARDSVTVVLKNVLVMDSAAIERYTGTFRNEVQQVTLRLVREGRTLVVERIDRFGDRSRFPVEFLSSSRLAVRDGTELAVTLDAAGRALGLQRGRASYPRVDE